MSLPKPGRTINKAISPWIESLSTAYSLLLRSTSDPKHRRALIKHQRAIFNPVLSDPNAEELSNELESRLAISALLCVWMIARIINKDSNNLSLHEAENWFLGNSASYIPAITHDDMNWLPRDYQSTLLRIPINHELNNLLPYILEVFDLLDVDGKIFNRDDRRAHHRIRGIVYTPVDVADFIVNNTLNAQSQRQKLNKIPTCIDPACGTGVFLISALRTIKERNNKIPVWKIIQNLYGIDIDLPPKKESSYNVSKLGQKGGING